MVSIPSPQYFINSCTIRAAPAVFLFLRLSTHLFTSFPVSSLDPSEQLSSLSDASTFASAQALIFSNSASNALLVVGVPSFQ